MKAIEPEAILDQLAGLDPGVRRESYYGERSLFYNPGRQAPLGVIFASVKDDDGPNDRASRLSREGVYRLAFQLTPQEYAGRFGPAPQTRAWASRRPRPRPHCARRADAASGLCLDALGADPLPVRRPVRRTATADRGVARAREGQMGTQAPTLAVGPGPDGRDRCWWCLGAPEYIEYHDRVWGRPMHGERELFEMLTLEAFQSGLSWLTILRKQPGFRQAFDDWDVERIAAYGEREVDRLLADSAIIRHRGKIEATIQNARAVCSLHGSGETLDALLWSFAPAGSNAPPPPPRTGHELPAKTRESAAMAKELKRHGFRFVGPTTAYSLMQAAGLVNDHLADCEFRDVPRVRARQG